MLAQLVLLGSLAISGQGVTLAAFGRVTFMKHTPGISSSPSAEDLAIVGLLGHGHTDDVVARRLGLSKRTYRRRLERVMEKLGATSRFEAGVRAAHLGWISGEGDAQPGDPFWPPELQGQQPEQAEMSAE